MTGKSKIEYDAATREWFRNKPKWMVTTVAKCEKCGLYYKSSLGHKCEAQEPPHRLNDGENRSSNDCC